MAPVHLPSARRSRCSFPAWSIALALCLLASPALAAEFRYTLGDHPDGNEAPPLYGLRLDELFDVTKDHDVFTFSFEQGGAGVELVYDDGGTPGDGELDDDRVMISGTVFGGLVEGGAWVPGYSGLWGLKFAYTTNFVSAGAEGSNISIGAESALNEGAIAPLFDVGVKPDASLGLRVRRLGGGDSIPLTDEDGGHDYSFRFDNQRNHRLEGTGLSGPEVFAGDGWLNHSGEPHVYASDWIFTGRRQAVVPEPASVALVTVGLLGLALFKPARRPRAR